MKNKKTKKSLKKSKQSKISKEISLLMNDYKKTGKMHTSRAAYKPKNKKKALKQALAIAINKYKK